MIRVERGIEPAGFLARAQQWQTGFTLAKTKQPDLSANQFWPTVRREIRRDADLLFRAGYYKCAYCESVVRHVDDLQLEHYRPKSKFVDQMFNWQNWLPVCSQCNKKKGQHFPQCGTEPCLIDPAGENPEDHLTFWEANITARTNRGTETITIIALERHPLLEERAKWLLNIKILALLALSPEFYHQVRSYLIWAMQPNAPYSAMVRAYLTEYAPRLANPEQPHPWVELQEAINKIETFLEPHKNSLYQLS